MPNDVADWTSLNQVNLIGGVSKAVQGDLGGAVLSPDAASDTITTGGGPVVGVTGVLASFKAAAASVIARVGLVGGLTVGSNTSVSPTFGQATVAGHLLVCVVSASQAVPTTAAAGWAQVVQASSDPRANVAIWSKPNCGSGEAAPVFTGAGGTAPMVAQLLEFSGVATATPTDQTALSGASGPAITLGAAANDAAFGDLVVMVTCWLLTSAATATQSQAFNNGGVAVQSGLDGSLATARHSSFSYAILPSAIVAQPLGVQNWPYDVVGSNAPAAGSAASVVLAATTGKSYTAASIDASMISTVGAASGQGLQLKDGASAIWTQYLAIPAAAGSEQHIEKTGAAFKGTIGNSMTLVFQAGTANVLQSANLGAYLR